MTPTDAPSDAVCARHADRDARIECARCGDYACRACRAYVLCARCAREGPPAFRPLPRARYLTRWLPLVPVPLVALAMWVVRELDWLDVTSALWFYTGGLTVLIVAIVAWLVSMYGGGSVLEADAASRRLRELRETDATPAELAALAPKLIASPKAHAQLLLALARAHLSAGEPHHASPLLYAIDASGWLRGEPALEAIRADVRDALRSGGE